jgi:hypothetical protein
MAVWPRRYPPEQAASCSTCRCTVPRRPMSSLERMRAQPPAPRPATGGRPQRAGRRRECAIEGELRAAGGPRRPRPARLGRSGPRCRIRAAPSGRSGGAEAGPGGWQPGARLTEVGTWCLGRASRPRLARHHPAAAVQSPTRGSTGDRRAAPARPCQPTTRYRRDGRAGRGLNALKEHPPRPRPTRAGAAGRGGRRSARARSPVRTAHRGPDQASPASSTGCSRCCDLEAMSRLDADSAGLLLARLYTGPIVVAESLPGRSPRQARPAGWPPSCFTYERRAGRRLRPAAPLAEHEVRKWAAIERV